MGTANPSVNYRIPIVEILNNIVRRIAEVTAWFNVALIGVILLQVVMRYGFNRGLVPLEELMWHLYAVAFMFGMAYAYTMDSHIRVDIVHMFLSPRAKHILEILGILFLFFPVIWILLDHSISWAIESFRVGEASANPTGLPYRWIIKAVVPITCVLLMIAGVARLIQEVALLFHLSKEPEDQLPGRVTMMRRFFRVEAIESEDKGGVCK